MIEPPAGVGGFYWWKTMGKHTKEDLMMMQALPLSVKVRMTETRIRQWVQYYGEDGVYISFSGGKDSTVLLHLVRGLYPDIPAVFVNTGLEFPEIQNFVKRFDNVEILTPKMRFTDVITKYGYPFISKDVSRNVYYARRCGPDSTSYKKLFGIEDFTKSKFAHPKYAPLYDADFMISDECCAVMKKRPAHSYSKQTGKMAITGQQANESVLRMQHWLQQGCNAYDNITPVSNPLSFWTEQDILQYIKTENIEIASVYGDIVQVDEYGYEYDFTLDDKCQYKTTGCSRTGCIFCGFGAHLEKGEGRFQRLKKTHPKQYDYCMGGGAHDTEDGLWKPTKDGLGMAYVIDQLCRIFGKDFIKY